MKDNRQKSGFSFRRLTGFLTGQEKSAPKQNPAAQAKKGNTSPFAPKSPNVGNDKSNQGFFAKAVAKIWPRQSREETAAATRQPAEFGSVAYETPAKPAPAPAPSAARQTPVAAAPTGTAIPAQVTFPLQPIVDALPENLRGLFKGQGSENVTLGTQPLLNQLSSGSVRICFGEIRNSVPAAFANNPQFDGELISIPLDHVISRLGNFLPARRTKRRIEVPDDIADAFTIPKAPRAVAPRVEEKKPAAPPVAKAPAAPVAAPVIPFPSAKPQPAPQKTPPAPAKPIEPAPAQRTPVAAPQAAKAQPVPAPTAPPPSPTPLAAKPTPAPAAAAPKAVPPPQPAAPIQAIPAVTQAAVSENSLAITIGAICQGWPDAVLHEIETARLKEVSVALPFDRLEPALKTGRIVFTWGEISKWMEPAWSGEVTNESAELELPLDVIAPAFMAQKRGGRTRKKVALDQTIPDVFAAQRKAAAASVAPPAPAAAPVEEAKIAAPIPMPTAPRIQPAPAPVAVAPKPAPAPAPTAVDPDLAIVNEALGLLSKGEWALQDLANQTIRLKGVGGLLIATLDGFLVASATPPQWRDEMIAGLAPEVQGEVMAALFPQLFTKLNEYFKDLEFGQMTNLRFTVGNLNFAVFKAGDLFFAALGRSGEKLPEQSLETIATALAKRPV